MSLIYSDLPLLAFMQQSSPFILSESACLKTLCRLAALFFKIHLQNLNIFSSPAKSHQTEIKFLCKCSFLWLRSSKDGNLLATARLLLGAAAQGGDPEPDPRHSGGPGRDLWGIRRGSAEQTLVKSWACSAPILGNHRAQTGARWTG